MVAFPEIGDVDVDESIDWAIEMIELGYESSTLYKLASVSKPANYFETIQYVKKAVPELGLTLKIGDDAILSFASFFVQQIAAGERIRENLTELYEFCKKRDYEELVYDFYLLYWAWDRLDCDDSNYSGYWDGAGRENIGRIVVREAKKWIEKNRHRYEQN
jgi:hypothetical protein